MSNPKGGNQQKRHLFGISLVPSSASPDKALEIAKLVDNLGSIDMIGIQDHPYTATYMDTWTLLTALATSTRRVRFFTNVADIPLRQPSVLAKAASTLDLLTKGRIELGIGAGTFWKAIHGYGGPSRSPAEAVAALEEAIQVIRLIWDVDKGDSRRRVNFDGKFYQLHDALSGPSPYHSIEIWVGAQGPKMLGIIGKLGDGWSIPLQSYLPSDKINAAQKIIDDAAHAKGRSAQAIRRIRGLAGIIDEEGGLDKSLHGQGEIVVGSLNDWVEELLFNINELGIDSFVFWPAGEGQELDQIHLFAENVVPAVKKRIGDRS